MMSINSLLSSTVGLGVPLYVCTVGVTLQSIVVVAE